MRWIRTFAPGALFLSALALSGCAGTDSAAVLSRASLEFGCDESVITVTNYPANAYRARGCGRDAIYVCRRDMVGELTCEKDGNRCDEAPATAGGAEPGVGGTTAGGI